MKTLSCILSVTLALALAPFASAQAKKKPADAAKPADTAKPADAKPAADAKPKAAKPIPFDTIADEIDAAGKTFTHNNQDGKKVKFIITATTVVEQNKVAAKFEDIKVGDSVAGLRVKKNDDGTEYDVVKITKFGAKPTPTKVDAKKGDAKKPEAKK